MYKTLQFSDLVNFDSLTLIGVFEILILIFKTNLIIIQIGLTVGWNFPLAQDLGYTDLALNIC